MLEIGLAEREIGESIKRDARVKRLLPIPGIGLISAATVLSEIGDVARFPSADKLCAWAGLTSSEHSSNDNVRRGHISKQGSRWLRRIMVEAAIHAYGDPRSASSSSVLLGGVAPRSRASRWRRLLTLVFYALRSETACRSYPVALSSTLVEARSQAVIASR